MILSLVLLAALQSVGVFAQRPEPMDVPAIEVSAPSEIVWQSGPFDIQSCTNGGHIVEGNGLIACEGGKRKTCADKSRVLLTAENGEKHCVLFQP